MPQVRRQIDDGTAPSGSDETGVGSGSAAPQTLDAPAADLAQPVARRYHIHPTFMMYCGVTLMLSVGAFHNNNNLLFWLFALAFSLIVVSGLISGPMLMGLRLERLPPPEVAQGEVVRVAYRVTNINRFVPAFAMWVREVAPAPETNSRWRFRRAAPSPAPMSVAPRTGELDRPLEAFVAYVGAGKSVVVDGLARATARGLIPLGPMAIYSDFPFGIVRKSVRFAAARSLLIRPQSIDEALPTATDSRARPEAEHAGRLSPIGGEHFHALREYQPGDNPRLIAWRASARAAARDAEGDTNGPALLVRQTTGTVPGRLDVLLDLASAGSKQAYERAISRAAGVIHTASALGMRVGLSVRGPADNGSHHADRLAEPRSGRWHAARLQNDLAMLPAFDRGTAQSPAGSAARPIASPTGTLLIAASSTEAAS